MRGGGGGGVGEGEFKKMAHRYVCVYMNGMFEREKKITEGSEINIISKNSKLNIEI